MRVLNLFLWVFVLKFLNVKARLHDGRLLKVADWQPSKDEYWAITGTNGSGKTVLSMLPAGKVVLSEGQVDGLPSSVSFLSLEAQAEYIENERKLDQRSEERRVGKECRSR